MERLTKRCKQALNDKMTKFKKFIEIALSEPKYHEKGNFSTQSTYDIYENNKLYPMASKLADYEDAEEQGLLLRLPCKVGTHIYMINHYWIDEGHICGIAEADDIDCFCFKVYCDPDDYTMVAIADFNETWFLTREEAEKALADMGV